MADDGAVRLRRASRADWDLIRGWLARPDIEARWGPRSATEAEVDIASTPSMPSAASSRPAARPVGYAHAVDATMRARSYTRSGAGHVDLDLFIASEDHRGQGVGQSALTLLKDEVFGTTFAIAVCIFPSVKPRRAVRAYEKAGFPLEAHLERPTWDRSYVDGR